MGVRIRVRRDTAANWNTANPTLADGERGYDKTSKRLKTGDGATLWNALAYDKILYADITDPPAAQDLSTYATTASVNTALNAYTPTSQLDATYATDAQLATAVTGLQTAAQVNAIIASAVYDGGNAAG